jgi:hypothetical protein
MNFMDELLRWKTSGLLTSEEMAELLGEGDITITIK